MRLTADMEKNNAFIECMNITTLLHCFYKYNLLCIVVAINITYFASLLLWI